MKHEMNSTTTAM